MSLKLLKESRLQMICSRGWGYAYVSEYATTWRVTFHVIGWAMPSILEQRVKKVKGDTAFDVAQRVIDEAESRNEL